MGKGGQPGKLWGRKNRGGGCTSIRGGRKWVGGGGVRERGGGEGGWEIGLVLGRGSRWPWELTINKFGGDQEEGDTNMEGNWEERNTNMDAIFTTSRRGEGKVRVA